VDPLPPRVGRKLLPYQAGDRASGQLRAIAVGGEPRANPKVGPQLHDTRHAANSAMAAAGIPDHVRARWCGHTTAVNVSTYTHANQADLVTAGAALAAIFGAA